MTAQILTYTWLAWLVVPPFFGSAPMNLMDWLRRLGILRFGAEGASYHSAAERPASMQMDDVFDSQKDPINLDRPRERDSFSDDSN